mmetsp:Transcript_25409/g.45941  ORF Transcript_25409/g.45941 Transcript_25409/m.45941 type:complete len:183 (+) Transcript_25409:91-639(+)|eukprot:CAMPEP_0201607650 /NCGR_PEP_ID=MMETSP0492-20130828/6689_1 /ASSEMBLY_ACC=CAM_ASM_000837 /TAXON_ID=420259 /ORGANISM="Thalassiosira gravida, Strain GMp14c1" /LENGTH=182 /DNA_ID=CAMNT_0048072281 /DNA_START=153 /DNA_END=701 /DNA_ORIENTATION=+
MKSPSLILSLLASTAIVSNGFVINNNPTRISRTTNLYEQQEENDNDDEEAAPTGSIERLTSRPDFAFSFEVPKKGIADVGTAEVTLPPILESSELVVVRYALPFGLNAEPQNGQVIVTKDGKADGGERVGDVLRQTTYWRGNQPGLFDVSKNAENFDLVVQALVTNDLAVADEIVLVFERPC